MTVSMIEVHPTSNNIYDIGYDADAQELHARFIRWGQPTEPGGPRVRSPGPVTYVYQGVPQAVYDDIIGLANRNLEALNAGNAVERGFTQYFTRLIIKDPDSGNAPYAFRKVAAS